jgi:scyllo-inositol 2-dehydrogenase (NADP+)
LGIAVGLVGFGFSARTLHRPLIEAAGMNIVAVVSRHAEAVREALPQAQVLPDLDALLAVPGLDLVVIATPNQLHLPQALAALGAGRHVVLDKPMALSGAECDRLIAAAAAHRRQLSVFHNRRWDSDFLTLRRLLEADALGPVLAFEARWDRYRPTVPDRWRERPECGGGVLLDLGAHLIDQALCLFGMPEWIEADVFAQREGARADDGFEIRMARGAQRIRLGSSSLAADAALRYRVHGLRAAYRKAGMDMQEQQLRAGLAPADPAFGVEPESQWGGLYPGSARAPGPPPRAVRAERGDWCAFYRALRAALEAHAEGRPGVAVPVSPRSAAEVIRLIEAARLSSAEGRRIWLRSTSSAEP